MHIANFTEQDKHYMARAVELAKKGRFTTSPNPNVGCVIAADNIIVGEGFHEKAPGVFKNSGVNQQDTRKICFSIFNRQFLNLQFNKV